MSSEELFCHDLLPCSGTITADLFLNVVYAFILGVGSRLISLGSEYLLEILSPGIIGGLVLPLLGTLPDAAIIFVSCLGGTPSEIQHKVTVGVGSLTGGNTFLITIPWAIAVFRGRCDISAITGLAKNKVYTGWSWKNSGVSVMSYTPVLCRIMIGSLFPYLIITLAFIISEIQGSSLREKEKYWALSTSILCLVGFIAYSIYQMYDVRYQERKLTLIRKRFLWDQFLKHVSTQVKNSLKKRTFERSLSVPSVKKHRFEHDVAVDKNKRPPKDEERLNLPLNDMTAIQPIAPPLITDTTTIGSDVSNNNNTIITDQLQQQQQPQLPKELKDNRLLKISNEKPNINFSFPRRIKDFSHHIIPPTPTHIHLHQHLQQTPSSKLNQSQLVNTDQNNNLGKVFQGLQNRINDLDEDDLLRHVDTSHQQQHQIVDLSIDPYEEEPKDKVNKRKLILKALSSLLFGTALIFLFADAFVETITRFSSRIGIQPFYISFVVAPFALNASELVSSWILSGHKKRKHISLIHSSLYGAVAMNNLVSLGILLFMIYFRGLIWNFSAETLVIFIVTMVVGILGGFRITFNLIHAAIVFSLFPLSIILIAVLESSSIGWS